MKTALGILATAVVTGGLVLAQSPTHAAGSQVSISKKDCQRLVRHQARKDVAYKPGVDVRSKKVTGANLNGGNQLKLPKEFSFDLNIDIAKKYGLDKKGISADMNVGKVMVKGRNVYFNGQRLGGGDQVAIAAECQKTLRGK